VTTALYSTRSGPSHRVIGPFLLLSKLILISNLSEVVLLISATHFSLGGVPSFLILKVFT
jgi:hypothetical protein